MYDLPSLIFMGTPGFAVPSLRALLDAGAPILLVVTQPDRPKGRGRRVATPPVKQLALENDDRCEEEVQRITDRLLHIFDLDEDQTIGPNEFADFYGVFGLSVSLAETVFAELDTNGDGRITRDELLEMSRQFYRSDDVEAPGNFLFGPYGA